jgi:hypothetical protein
MIGVPVPPGKRGGIFNRVKGSPAEVATKSKRLAQQVEETITSNYGVIAPAFLRKLLAKRPKLTRRVRRIIDKFVKRVGADTDPWERRFAQKFGIVLAAAILLSEFGIAPWTKKRARIATTVVYKKARAACVSVNEATDALIRHLRKVVVAGERFPLMKKAQALSPKKAAQAWGVTKDVPKVGRVVLAPYSRIQRMVTPPAITRDVLTKLAHESVVRRAADGKLTRQTMIKGLSGSRRRRYVCFSRKALFDRA